MSTARLNLSHWHLFLLPLGAVLILVGYFHPWVPHPAAGLAITGFEMGEWIKFTSAAQSVPPTVSRSGFYWPPFVAVLGIAAWAGAVRRGRGRSFVWLALVGAALALLPMPIVEELGSLASIRANAVRLGLVVLGWLAVALSAWSRIGSRTWGAGLAFASVAGLHQATRAFTLAEPVIEAAYNRLIDPGLGYHVARVGMAVLLIGAVLLAREKEKRCSG